MSLRLCCCVHVSLNLSVCMGCLPVTEGVSVSLLVCVYLSISECVVSLLHVYLYLYVCMCVCDVCVSERAFVSLLRCICIFVSECVQEMYVCL